MRKQANFSFSFENIEEGLNDSFQNFYFVVSPVKKIKEEKEEETKSIISLFNQRTEEIHKNENNSLSSNLNYLKIKQEVNEKEKSVIKVNKLISHTAELKKKNFDYFTQKEMNQQNLTQKQDGFNTETKYSKIHKKYSSKSVDFQAEAEISSLKTFNAQHPTRKKLIRKEKPKEKKRMNIYYDMDDPLKIKMQNY